MDEWSSKRTMRIGLYLNDWFEKKKLCLLTVNPLDGRPDDMYARTRVKGRCGE